MKKILGLDLGTTSIGWALVAKKDEKSQILGLGCRIIPLNPDDKKEFLSGNTISKNQKRTVKRTQRKGYDRYQLRRKNLQAFLAEHSMLPDESLIRIDKLALWKFRADAASKQVSLQELGRVLLHLNQKRGYKSSRKDSNLDKKETAYVTEVKGRYQLLKESGKTIGEKFHDELSANEFYKVKQQVFPREAYIEEFEKICSEQQKHYPSIISESFIAKLRDKIIYYQRKLKSQKGLVSVCEFEGVYKKVNNKGKETELFVGPKVAHKSSPLAQLCKIWENINNITIKNKKGEVYVIPNEKKVELFNYLDTHERLTQTDLFKILGIKDGWYGNKQLASGLRGNIAKVEIGRHLGFDHSLLKFNTEIIHNRENEVFLVDRKTGAILNSNYKKVITAEIEKQPFYQLWHTIYSISDETECVKALIKKFGIADDTALKLAGIDFTKHGFGNKSVKAMRKILPYLMEGHVYSDACSYAGYNHSNSLTNDENYKRQLLDKLPNLPKNSLRQPIIEKILNQLINLVNAVKDEYGNIDEIRIELARELKQSKEERNDAFIAGEANNRLREEIEKRLAELGVRGTKRNIEKYKFIFPVRTVFDKDGKFVKKNFESASIHNQCIYCGDSFNLSEALNGDNFDIDHIIPKSLLFDDSQTNRVLVHRKCNADDKKNKTAYDFIRAKGDAALTNYLDRLEKWYKNGVISYAKLDRLKVSYEDYIVRKQKGKETEADKKLWESFIDRDLRETQYIAKKSKEILEKICYNVWCTSGSITEKLRRLWGWDDVLMNLNLPKFRKLGLTEFVEWETKDGQKHKKEVIKNWSKRDDHRHHVIDALVIACTEQGFIQRVNTLSSEHTRNEMYAEVKKQSEEYKEKLTLLEKYLLTQRPFATIEIEAEAEKVLVAFKAGKKVATISKFKAIGKNRDNGVIVPRGALSEESVYGTIKRRLTKEIKLSPSFSLVKFIINKQHRQLVEKRLSKFNNEPALAFKGLAKNPIYLNEKKTETLEKVTVWYSKDEYVIKYPVENITPKDLEFVVDKNAKKAIENHLTLHNNNVREAYKDLETNPVWLNKEKNIPIKSVRCYTGLTVVAPIKKDEQGKAIGFVKPGNNHHIAIYIDAEGNKQEHVVTFWHTVERVKYGIPIVIENPSEVWSKIIDAKIAVEDELFKSQLPQDGWRLVTSMQQNELFVFNISQDEINEAEATKDYTTIGKNLFRVRKITSGNYWFNHIYETEPRESVEDKRAGRCIQASLSSMTGIKIKLNNLGKLVPTIGK